MRRILAVILAFSAIASFSACGDGVTPRYDAPGFSTSDRSGNDTNEPKADDMSGGLSAEDADGMTETMSLIYSSMKERDLDCMINGLYTEELVGYMLKYGSVEELKGMLNFAEADSVDLDALSVKSAEDADEETARAVRVYYSSMLSTFRVMDEMDIDMKTLQSGGYSREKVEEFQEAVKDFDVTKNLDDPDAELVIDIPEVKNVGFSGINGSEGRTMLMYKVDGEGWKLDMFVGSMMTYVRTSRQDSVNSMIKNIVYSALSALEEMDEDGIDISGCCIISSDSSKNKFGADCALEDCADTLIQRMNYYTDLDAASGGNDYFLVFVDGVCVYGVIGKDNYSGMYPARKRMISLGRSDSNFELVDPSKFTYEQLYEECAAFIK